MCVGGIRTLRFLKRSNTLVKIQRLTTPVVKHVEFHQVKEDIFRNE